MSASIVKTDRSRIVAFQDCPRYRWLKYHAGEAGRGYERVALSLPRLNGSFMHAIAATALTGGDWRGALAVERAQYQAQTEARGIEGSPDVLEQLCLLEGLATLWVARRLPAILAEFDVVEVEQEHVWPMTARLHDMVRVDALLRRKTDGALFLKEFKTARAFSPGWAAQFKHNSQILANLQAMESITGERIEGVEIEGMLKAPYLAWLWRHSDGSVSLRGHKGWVKEPIWESMTTAEWVAHPIWSDLDRDQLFNPLVATRPASQQLERWREATIAQELDVERRLALLDATPEIRRKRQLNLYFPMHDNHCNRYFGHACEMERLCYTEEVEADPLGSGLYQVRQPHHDEEGGE